MMISINDSSGQWVSMLNSFDVPSESRCQDVHTGVQLKQEAALWLGAKLNPNPEPHALVFAAGNLGTRRVIL
jgi:hypothetical protein